MKKNLIFSLILMLGIMISVVSAVSLDLCQKDSTTWQCVSNGVTATLEYNKVGQEFVYSLTTSDSFNEDYILIYYADQPDRFVNWGGNPALYLGTLTAGEDTLTGSVDTGSLPFEDDWNTGDCLNTNEEYADYCLSDGYKDCTGAKIWLIPSSDYSANGEGEGKLKAWNPENYLFETDLISYKQKGGAPTDENGEDQTNWKRTWLQNKNVPGKGILHAPGLQKPRPNENFAKGTENAPGLHKND